MTAQAELKYDGILIGDCRLTGTIKVPEDLIGRKTTPDGDVLVSEQLLSFLKQYMHLNHRGKDVSKTVDLNVTVHTADHRAVMATFPQSFRTTAGDPLLHLNPLPEEKKAAEAPAEAVEAPKQRFGYITCPKCKGSGSFASKNEVSECRKCHGSGQIYDADAAKEQKDAALPKDRQKRIEQESEDAAFSRYRSKRGH